MSDPVITPKETYKAIVEMNSKLDILIKSQDTFQKDNEELTKRVSAVEKKQIYFSGGVAGIFTILTLFGGKIKEAIFG